MKKIVFSLVAFAAKTSMGLLSACVWLTVLVLRALNRSVK